MNIKNIPTRILLAESKRRLAESERRLPLDWELEDWELADPEDDFSDLDEFNEFDEFDEFENYPSSRWSDDEWGERAMGFGLEPPEEPPY